jgi:hypothetical protein
MIRIGSIVLRVDDLQRQTEFWEAALGYVRRNSGESDDFVLLGPPDGAPEVWSVYGAERSQPVATGGRWDDLESGSDTRKPLPWVATSCPDPKMVRRGSTVRVRQRALQKRRKTALFVWREVARSAACGGYGALYGALRFRADTPKRRKWTHSPGSQEWLSRTLHSRLLVNRLTIAGRWVSACRTSVAADRCSNMTERRILGR